MPPIAMKFPSCEKEIDWMKLLNRSEQARHSPKSTYQSLIVLSWLPDAINFESGEKERQVTFSLWPFKVNIKFLDSQSHSIIVLSSLPEANSLLLGEKHKELTVLEWAERVYSFSWVLKSQIMISTWLYSLDIIYYPSGEKITVKTKPQSLKMRVFLHYLFSTLHILIVSSSLPETKNFESGEKAIEFTISLWPLTLKVGDLELKSHKIISLS